MTNTRIVPLMVGVLALAGALLAQSKPAPAESKPDARAQLRGLYKEQMATMTAFQIRMRSIQKAVAKAKAAGEPGPKPPDQPDFLPLVGKFEAAAADHARTDDAVPFLVWIMTVGSNYSPDAGKRAAATLAEHHGDSPDLDELAPLLPQLKSMVGDDVGGKLLAAIREHNQDRRLLGWVAFAEHATVIDQAKIDSAEFAAAKKVLLAVAKKARSRLRSEITDKIEMREKFGGDQTAPDIAGVDLDGVEFKLSDYKGKVVFLDFWGDW